MSKQNRSIFIIVSDVLVGRVTTRDGLFIMDIVTVINYSFKSYLRLKPVEMQTEF